MRSLLFTPILLSLLCLSPLAAHGATGDLLWSGDIGGDKATWSSPLLYGNLVIVKGQDGGLTALSSATGSQIWYNADIAQDITSPILYNNVLYLGADIHFYKINPATGAVLTDRVVGNPMRNRAPAALDNMLFFTTSADTGSRLHAVSGDTLSDVWTKGLLPQGSVLGDDVNLYALSDTLAALDPATGAQRWAVSPPTGYAFFDEGALADGYLVAFASSEDNSDHVLTAWHVGDGAAAPAAVAWTQSFGNSATDGAPPVIDDGRVFVTSGNGQLRAYALTTGTPLWTAPVRDAGAAPPQPVAVDGKVYVQDLGATPAMLCLDGATGAQVWKTELAAMGTSWGQPALGGGRVYLATDWNGVFAFNAGSLSHIWPMYKNNPAQTSASTTPAPPEGVAVAALDLLLLQ